MLLFHLQHRTDGRVILSQELDSKYEFIRSIEADTWIEARDQIEHYEFKHRPGYGYFVE